MAAPIIKDNYFQHKGKAHGDFASAVAGATPLTSGATHLTDFLGYSARLLLAGALFPITGFALYANEKQTTNHGDDPDFLSDLAKKAELMPSNNPAEIAFANAYRRLHKKNNGELEKWRKNGGHFEDLPQNTRLPGRLPSTETLNFALTTGPAAAIAAVYTAAAFTIGKPLSYVSALFSDAESSYGSSYDAQEVRMANAAIGLMTGQLLSIMTPQNKDSYYYNQDDASRAQLDDLRQAMYDNVQTLMPQATDATPFSAYKKALDSELTTRPIPSQTAGKPDGLTAARTAISTHYKGTIGNSAQNTGRAGIDKAETEYDQKISALNGLIQQKELSDPRVIHAHLHALRIELATDTQTASGNFLKDSLSESAALFEAAKKIHAHNDTITEADLSSLRYPGDINHLRARAEELLDGLKNAGSLTTQPMLSVEGDAKTDATIISGDGATPEATIKTLPVTDDDLLKTLDSLKDEEAKRITNSVIAQNKDLNNKLSNLAENYHREVSESISAASHMLRLQGEQLKYALTLESTARPGDAGGLTGKASKLTSVEMLAKVINEGYPNPQDPNQDPKNNIKGIQGPAWNIEFTPSKPESENGLGGSYSVAFTGHSKAAKQNAIIDQASLIAFNSSTINFTARATRGGNGQRQTYDKRGTIEMALMQAIAIQSTSGLDPAKSTISISLGLDDKGKEVFSHPMTIEALHNYDSAQDMTKIPGDKEGRCIADLRLDIKVSDYYKGPKSGILSNYKGNRQYADYQHAVHNRAINDAGSDFAKQMTNADPEKVIQPKSGKVGLADSMFVQEFKRSKRLLSGAKASVSPAASATGGMSPSRGISASGS